MDRENLQFALPFTMTFFILIGGLAVWTDRNLDFWCSWYRGAPVDVPLWISVLASVCLNGVIFAINVVAELGRYLI